MSSSTIHHRPFPTARTIVKRAAIYVLSVSIFIGFVSFSNLLGATMKETLPQLPAIIAPLLMALVGVGVGILIWSKLRENDLLKYEFITIVAHKFRTPLTQVKWTAEELLLHESDLERRRSLQNIELSNRKLVGLTGTLIALAEADSTQSVYTFQKESLCEMVSSVAGSFKDMFEQKHIHFTIECPTTDIRASIDPERIKFVIQTLLENAYHYTKEGGSVDISISSTFTKANIVVKDTGVGIKQAEQALLFGKFYRAHTGKISDNEGFGVGLYLAQSIIKRHGGKITVFSEGEGKGSMFTVSLPQKI